MEQIITTEKRVSYFAQIVDKLRGMSEEELKVLYIQLFKDEIAKDFEQISYEMTFANTTDEDIDMAFLKSRYPEKYA